MIRAGVIVNVCFPISGLFVIIASLLSPGEASRHVYRRFVRFKMDGDTGIRVVGRDQSPMAEQNLT